MSQPAKPSLGRKVGKITGIILGGIFGFILLASVLLFTFLEPLAGRLLKDRVSEETEGLYKLAYEDLQINLLTGTLTLHQLQLDPDTAVQRQQRGNGAVSRLLYKAAIQKLRISRVNLADALLHNRLVIGAVTAVRPVITAMADENLQQDTAEEDMESFLGSLDALHVGQMRLQDAAFRYRTLGRPGRILHELPQVSLKITSLNIPARGQKGAPLPFQVDDVQFTASDYTYHAPDSVYQLHIDSLAYSSTQASLLLEGTTLLPYPEVNAALKPAAARKTLYHVQLPALQMTGLHLLEAFHTKELLLREVLLEKPKLRVLLNTNAAATPEPVDLPALYQSMAEYLTVIGIEELRLSGGSLNVAEKLEKLVSVHELDGANIALQEIRIDSSTLHSPRDHFFAEELHFTAEGYSFQHPLNPHTVKTGNITLSTRDKRFHLRAVQVTGDKERNDRLKQSGKAQAVVYNISTPGIHFNGVDLEQVWEAKELNIATIDVLRPAVELVRDKSVARADLPLQEAYASVSDFVSKLVIGNIRLQDASFTHLAGGRRLKRIQELEHASLKATGLVIDSAFVYSPSAAGVPVEEAVLTAHGYTFRTPDNLYTYTLDRIHYSTRTQVLAAHAVALASNKEVHSRLKSLHAANRNMYDIAANYFRVTGLDVIKAINTGELQVDQVVLRQPEFAMLKDRTVPEARQQQPQSTMDGLYSIVDPIKVKSLRLEDGTFTYREKRDEVLRTQVLEHASATVLGLNLGSARLGALDEVFPMEEMILTARDYTYTSPGGIYTVTLDSLHYSSRQQELTARRIDVVSDKEENQRLKLQHNEQVNRTLFDVSAEKFRVRGLDLIRAYETGQFAMEEMLLSAPEVTILQDREISSQATGTEDKIENQDDSETLQQIATVVETFRVNRLQINDGTVRLNVLKGTVSASQTIAHVSVTIDQLRTTPQETSDAMEMFQVDDIGVLVRNYSYLLPDSLYEVRVGEISASLRGQSLMIEDLRLLPLYDKEEFVSRLTYEEDRYDVHVPRITLTGINLNALFNNQDIILEKALVQNPEVNIYRDKRIPEDPDRRPPTLQQMLRQAPYYIHADTVAVESGHLAYAEVAPNGTAPGVLKFIHTTLEALHVTNDTTLLARDSLAIVSGSALLMGESKLSVRFLFHLDHPEDLYTYEGTLQSMDFTALNPLFENLIFVRIEDGQINKAAFSVEATAHVATGEMRLFYNDFEVLLLNKDAPENPGFLRKAGSWLLNKLVIKSNNPAGSRAVRIGAIEVDRDYQKSVFNHMSKALVDGITSSLMVPFVERIADKLITF
ncbi:hypothetical protein GCM10027443_06020 [Pontibacter brevis]